MSISVISSKRRLSVCAAAVLLFGAFPAALYGQLSLDEALRAAFPAPATIERRTAFLRAEELEAARTQAGQDVPVTQRIVTYYLARDNGNPIGVAYFDSHRVRTLNEVIMIIVTPRDRIRTIEVLRFAEPPEYHASAPWLQQFKDQALTEKLSLKGAITNLSGATLTSNAIVRAARRVLALHGRIRPFQSASRTSP
jgi:hypothetical protein